MIQKRRWNLSSKLLVGLFGCFLGFSNSLFGGNGDMDISSATISRSMGGTGVAYYTSEIDAISENPALMSQSTTPLDSSVAYLSIEALFLSVHQTNGFTDHYYKNKMNQAVLPSLGYFYNFSDKIKFGLGLFIISSAGSDFSDTPEMYNIKGSVTSIKASPSLSYKILENFGIGLGPQVYYTQAKVNMTPPGSSTMTDNSGGTSIDYGLQIGSYYKLNDVLFFGIHYNTGTTAKIKNYVDINRDGNVDAVEIGIPSDYSLAVGYQLPSLKLGTTFEYKCVQWSTAAFYKDLGWTNSNVFAFGTEYFFDDSWIFRGGINYAKHPMKNVSGENGAEPAKLGKYTVNKEYISSLNAGGHNASEAHYTFGIGYKINTMIDTQLAYVYGARSEVSRAGTGNYMGQPYNYDYKEKGYSHQFDLAWNVKF